MFATVTPMQETYTHIITKDQHKTRLDKVLAQQFPDYTRSYLKGLIIMGCVQVNDKVMAASDYKVKEGEEVEFFVPEIQEATPHPQNIPLDLVYEDEHLLVINKAAGMVVHPAHGNLDGTLVNALLFHCGEELSGIRGVKMPGIVHRLDKDTSGLMVVAKSDLAHQHLTGQFANRTLFRVYLALVWGLPKPLEGKVEGRIGRHSSHRQKMAVLKYGGKDALTHYRCLENYGNRASLVQCRLHSGRTHQIRVHMSSIGCPLLGDPVYGKPPKWLANPEFRELKEILAESPRQALHAHQLSFIHPVSGDTMSFEAPLPAFMTRLIQVLEEGG